MNTIVGCLAKTWHGKEKVNRAWSVVFIIQLVISIDIFLIIS